MNKAQLPAGPVHDAVAELAVAAREAVVTMATIRLTLAEMNGIVASITEINKKTLAMLNRWRGDVPQPPQTWIIPHHEPRLNVGED